ncbi:hypothetical protein CKM354_000993900 [Cercospora kikuchii]|uniref:Uncharacterized protein n=1 Tax=Cercospora kikuchii TaxID=84275 RepID=A0A9P3FKM9_9PEZI|nr:uncharacterized protein CKM354_000993900 [Cercospora kikuchii]GIZ46830.1 hypothetical protein CKM354_000993900 [Cercospora kikuchii]
MASPILHSQSPTLLKIAGLGAFFPLTLGLIGTFSPYSGFKLFGLPEPTTPQAKKQGANLMMFWGSRDVYMGLTALAAWYEGAGRVLGWLYLCGTLVAISDGVQSVRETGGGAWKHVMWCPVVVGIAGGLLGWFD